MSTNSSQQKLPQPTEDESHVAQIITNDTKGTNKTTKENEEVKEIVSEGEVVVKIEESLPQNLKRNINDKDFMVYGYHGQNQVLPTTWVYFQQVGQQIPYDGGAPLDYTPDRNAFVRLVFIIVFIMIAATAVFNIIVYTSPALSSVFREYGLVLAIGSMVLMLGLNYAMACSQCARVVPCNIICLVLAVVAMSVTCCYITLRYHTALVLLAVIATAGVVLVCTLLACTSFDFTKWLLYVIVIASAFGIAALTSSLYMLISGNYIPILRLVMLVIGTMVSSTILIIELQMILGGKAVQLGEDDYALGAFMLYTSIIDIFLKLVQTLDQRNKFLQIVHKFVPGIKDVIFSI